VFQVIIQLAQRAELQVYVMGTKGTRILMIFMIFRIIR